MDFKYPYTDYHELNLDWFLSEFKNLVETWARTQQDWISMQQYIRDYFDNLNVQTEIDNKINAMILDGTFGAIVEPFVTAALPALVHGELPDVVADQIAGVVAAQIDGVVAEQLPAVAASAAASLVGEWLADHIDPDTGYVIDDTLTVSQAAADAKVTGDRIGDFIANFFNGYDNNVLFGKALHRGYRYSYGSKIADADYAYTDMIPVSPNTIYKLIDTGTPFTDFYASDETYISTTTASTAFTVPATAAYMRISLYHTRYNTAKVVLYSDGDYINYGKTVYDNCDGLPLGVNENQIFDSFNNPASLNDCDPNRIYYIQRTVNTTTADFPSDFPTTGISVLNVYKAYYNTVYYQILQVLEHLTNGDVWRRSYNSNHDTWTAWVKTPHDQNEIIYIGAGQTYTTLRSGIAAAVAAKNKTVYVLPGTYDLVTEFSDAISSSMPVTGLGLGNNIHVIFMDGAKVTANFDNSGSTYDATTWRRIYDYFNPFYSSSGLDNANFTLENLDIECTDTRYCVHDEMNGAGTYVHRYINCRMKYKNTHSDVSYVQCIGGGLGLHGTIDIIGGYYECETDYALSTIDSGANVNNCQQCITYHNGNNASADSSITIKNVYLANRGYFRFGYYGTSTIQSLVSISGCSTGLPTLKKQEGSSTQTDNFTVVEWNADTRVTGVHWQVYDRYKAALVND